jgi:RecB family exonuclease
MRKTSEELNKLCLKYNVDRLWSWSRYHKYKTSPYEYYLTYISDKKPDRENSIYGASGGFAHDILEKFYSGEIDYHNMIDEFEDAWTTLGIAELKFDRTNEDKDNKIRRNYVVDLRHFFNNHNMINTKVDLERFIIIKVGDYIFHGYIDMTRKDSKGNYIIQDWKTSSIYKGEKAINEAGQLILYAEGLIQLGVPLNKIKICWNFIKYCNIIITQANGKNNEREIERCKIGESLKSNATMWLKKLGYIEELDYYINMLINTNDIKCLPKDVQDKYVFNDCYVYVNLTQEMIDGLKDDIIMTLNEIINKENEYKATSNDNVLWDSAENVEKQSYYFANLCGWSTNLHLPYSEYIKQLKEKERNKDNVFCGVGGNVDDSDLNWLNNL